MSLDFVDPKVRVATSPIVKQEVADRRVLKPDWLVAVFKDVNDGMQITQTIRDFMARDGEQRRQRRHR
jgi:hypothetical protein